MSRSRVRSLRQRTCVPSLGDVHVEGPGLVEEVGHLADDLAGTDRADRCPVPAHVERAAEDDERVPGGAARS